MSESGLRRAAGLTCGESSERSLSQLTKTTSIMSFQETENRPRKRRARRERQPSTKYMTLRETGDHFCVDESTVRKGLGVFSRLLLVATGRRTLVLRSSVERLDRELERAALVRSDKEQS